jgi:FkbM family methyltransferase
MKTVLDAPIHPIEAHLLLGEKVKIDPNATGIGGSWQGKEPATGMPRPWDPDTLQFFYEQTGKYENPVILDIGANTGTYCLLPVLNRSIRGYAFEPNPAVYRILKNNLTLNALQNNIQTIPVALSDRKGLAKLKIPVSGNESGLACLGTPQRFHGWNEVSVPMDTLDNIAKWKNITHVDLIKIDTEGCELMVLLGGEKIIRKLLPNILLEFEERNTAQFGYHPNQIVSLLTSWGYDYIKISKSDAFFFKKEDMFHLYSVNNQVASSSINSSANFIFDTKHAESINSALLNHLKILNLPITRKSVFEVGAGIGKLTHFFENNKCQILSTEARFENIIDSKSLIDLILQKQDVLDNTKTTKLQFCQKHIDEIQTHKLNIHTFKHNIDVLKHIENRLYYRDQSTSSLESLTTLAINHAPTVIVELGTLSGMSTRAWVLAAPNARIHAVDLSFKPFWKANEYFPIDTSRITFHETNILSMDFRSLWSASDRVLFFVNAHDQPTVPIMQHVQNNALPYLPKGSLVVVDDVWFSSERLDPKNGKEYFNQFLLGQIDELQCFTGHYAPYHLGGSFMGFREVIPFLEFVNTHGIDLQFQPNDKHVWFEWDIETHATGITPSLEYDDAEWGMIDYNPLQIQSSHPLAQRVLHAAEHLYREGKIQDAAALLNDLLKKQPNPEACLALAICLARLGGLVEAHNLASAASRLEGSNERIERLQRDLSHRLGAENQRKTGNNGVTIFAIPKSFTGHTTIIQRNAIRSWTRLTPRPEIILFGDEPGIAEMAREVDALHIAEVERNEFGTPLVDALFRSAAQVAQNDILAYVNADIILFDDFMTGTEKVAASHEEFLLIGRRWDLTVCNEIHFEMQDWQGALLAAVSRDGFLHAETGLDYFVHTKGLWVGMPPFALGRCAWDNWLVKWPIVMGKTVIDASGCITAVHQDHGYAHAGGRANAFSGLEPQRNRAMAGSMLGWSTDAPFQLTAEGQISRREPLPASFDRPETKAARVRWLIVQAGKLMAKGHHELAAVKYEEAAQLQPENARIGGILALARRKISSLN